MFLCEAFVSMRSLCFYAKPVVSIVSIVVLIICLAMQISYKFWIAVFMVFCCVVAPIIYKKSLFSTPTEPLLVWKRGSFVWQ